MKKIFTFILVFTIGLFVGLLICLLLFKRYTKQVNSREKEIIVYVSSKFYPHQYLYEVLNLKLKINNLIKYNLDAKKFKDSILNINNKIGTSFFTPQLNVLKYAPGYFEVLCYTESAFKQNYYFRNYYLFTPDTLYEINIKPLKIVFDTLRIVNIQK
jgi:hypothetical protein